MRQSLPHRLQLVIDNKAHRYGQFAIGFLFAVSIIAKSYLFVQSLLSLKIKDWQDVQCFKVSFVSKSRIEKRLAACVSESKRS